MKSVEKESNSPARCLIRQYMNIMKLHRTVLERELNKTGVFRSQHQILMFLSENPNASQKDIANMHRVSTATIAVSLKKLEKGGYITRIVDQSDNRYNQIALTESGKHIVVKSKAFFQTVEAAMFDGFCHEDYELLAQLFDRLDKNLKTLLPETEREDFT